MPRFSLVLATISRVAELDRFITALVSQGTPDCEVIIVNQNRDDRLSALLASWSQHLSIRHLRSSPGLSRARNVGLQFAAGEIVTFPDDDCWYSPGLLQRIETFFAADPRCSILSIGVRDDSGTPSGNRWVLDSCDLNTANLFRTSVGYALFYRQSEISRALRFDESLGAGSGTPFACGEDTDFAFRLLGAGLHGRFERQFTVFHPRRDMMSGKADFQRAYSYGCGMGRVIRKQRKFALLPSFLSFDLLRTIASLFRGRLTPATLCVAHGRGILDGYFAAEKI